MNLYKKIFIISIGLALFLALYSCEATKFLNRLDDTSWTMSGKDGYSELLSFDAPEPGQFTWIQYSEGIEIDNVVGTYDTFSSVLGGESYANLNIIIEESKKNSCFQYYFPDPSRKGMSTMWLIGHEKTIYQRVIELVIEENSETEEENSSEEANDE